MKEQQKLNLIAVILTAAAAIAMLVFAVKSCLKDPENEKAKQEIEAVFTPIYRGSDSLVRLVPTDSLRPKFEALKKRRRLPQ